MDINPKLDRYGELLLTIGGILSGISAFLYGFYKFCSRHIKNLDKAIRFSNDLHHIYGHSPAIIIHNILFDLQKNTKELQIIQRFITKNIKLALYVCDEQGNCTWVNDELCELFGLDSESMYENKWLQVVNEEDRVRVWEEWKKCISLKIPYSSNYSIFNHRFNKTIHITTSTIYIKISDTQAFYVGYATEIKSH